MSRKKEEMERQQQIAEEIRRVRLPRDKETLGILDQRLGASRMRVRCMDGKTRICRIPGRLKRKIWVQEGDTLLVEPWELGGDEKGDIILIAGKGHEKYQDIKGIKHHFDDMEIVTELFNKLEK